MKLSRRLAIALTLLVGGAAWLVIHGVFTPTRSEINTCGEPNGITQLLSR